MSIVLRKLTLKDCSPTGIAKILKEKQAGREVNYKALLHFIRTLIEDDETSLKSLLKNMEIVVALFDKNCEALFDEIKSFEWEKIDNIETQKAIVSFLIALMNSQPFYTNRIIERCVKGLCVSENEKRILHRSNIEIIKFIASNMPAHLKFIRQKIAHCFPHKSRSLLEHRTYSYNILHVSKVVPVFFNDIIFTIVEKLVKVDSDVASSSSGHSAYELFSFDEDTVENNIQQREILEVKEKLDVLMSDMLNYIKEETSNGSEEYITIWSKSLIISFDSHVLKAQSSHISFLLFYFFNVHPGFSSILIDYFWDMFSDKNNPGIVRQTSIMYLASYTNRAFSVDLITFQKVLVTVSQWCLAYIAGTEDTVSKYRHDTFYAASQSLFYMFSYRHSELVSSSKFRMLLDKLNFTTIIHSKLNPLRYCSIPILQMFNRITSLYDVVMCNVIIERNSRILLSSTAKFDNEVYPFKAPSLNLVSQIIKPFFRDMVYKENLIIDKRRHKISENFEDWDAVMSENNSFVALSPNVQCMSLE